MRIFAASCLCMLLVGIAHAGDHYISHVAEEGWTTSITAYNDGPEDRTFDLYRYDAEGTQTVTTDHIVPAYGQLTLSNADFGYDGTAHIETPEEDSPLKIKLAYQYGESESLCEFFIPDGGVGQYWMLPNPFQAHFDWFGMAIAYFARDDVEITLTAWQNGSVVDTMTETVAHGEKLVDVSNGFWTGIQYADVDLVTIESSRAIPSPLSITGNTEQDRHVFFLGQAEVETDPPATHAYVIPHVAEDNWTTALTVYNNTDTAAMITLWSWNADGSVDVNGTAHAVPANGTLALAAGTDFAYEGIARITTDEDLNIKLTYRYGESESLCEFFLQETTSTQWFIPNSIHDWFDWFGLAICNPTPDPITVAVDAYKDGEFLSIGTKLLQPHTKTVGLAGDFWDSLSSKGKAVAYDDLDMVVIRSSVPIPSPLSITGNSEQDRHVFFLSAKDMVAPDFPDPSFKAYVLENFDTDENGYISTAEAEAVTIIDTPGGSGSRGTIRDLSGIEMFTNLQHLECRYEQLSWLPGLDTLTHLTILYANDNYLVTLPAMDTQTALISLNINWNSIALLPSLSALESLKYFYAANNKLNEFPDMSGLIDLRIFDVSENQLTEIPGVETLTTLHRIVLSYNAFSALPDLSASASLTDLYVTGIGLTSLPDLSIFPDLQTLNVGSNELTEIPGLASLSDLENFRCGYNLLTDISDIAGLTKLYNFDCSYNNITTLPDLSALTEMEYLYVTGNPISSIPGLTSMTKLRTLYADSTAITDFSDVAGLTSLEKLSIYYNNISVMPDLSELDNLNKLYCFDCELVDIPDVTGCDAIDTYRCDGNLFGPDDCPTIQAIKAMGLTYFNYNPQSGGDLICD